MHDDDQHHPRASARQGPSRSRTESDDGSKSNLPDRVISSHRLVGSASGTDRSRCSRLDACTVDVADFEARLEAVEAVPVWFLNLEANPLVSLQDGDEWWNKSTAVWPSYDEYRAKTDRQIPVVVLDPA